MYRIPFISFCCLYVLTSIVLSGAISGCVGEPPKIVDVDIEPTKTKNRSQADKKKPKTKNPKSPVHTDKDGHRWLGKVPFDVYDVFYDDPVAIANNQTIIPGRGGNTATTPADGTMPATPKTPTTPTTTTAAVDWKKLIPLKTLENESKELSNELSAKLQSVGTYNKSFTDIQILAATLAAVGQIASEHPDEIRWKKNAIAVRGLSTIMAEKATERGRPNFEKTKMPFDNLTSIFNGDTPSDLPAPPKELDLSLVIDRSLLMQRMEKQLNSMRTTVRNAKDLKSQHEETVHNAQVLSAWIQITSHKDYDLADEPSYQNFTRDMIKACQATIDASEKENFDDFKKGLSEIQKNCDSCHREYR